MAVEIGEERRERRLIVAQWYGDEPRCDRSTAIPTLALAKVRQ